MTEKLLAHVRHGPRDRVLRHARVRGVRDAAGALCFSDLVLGIVKSAPFQMRMSKATAVERGL